MQIDSTNAGARLKEFNTEATWRQTMNYAASVGDSNPCYFDDTRKGGVIAPPMFAEAVTWRVSSRIWEFLDSKAFPVELLMTQVHYTEHVRFHRPVVPDSKLKLEGEVVAILPHRAGSHVVIKYDALDKAGEPLFTMHTGAMLRGVECAGGGKGEELLPRVPDPPGDGPARQSKIDIHPLASYVYDGCADIFFPIHTSPRFAKSVGLPGIILQGSATLAHAAREIVDNEAGGDPLLLREIFCRFSGMVLPGASIVFSLDSARKMERGRELFFSVINAEGKKVLSGGYALVSDK